MLNNPSIPRQNRLRRVMILCCSFARNLAYYRIGRDKEYLHLMNAKHNSTFSFWRTVNGNFIDMCVLEWCKLFADRKGRHYWENIVDNTDDFRKSLLRHLGTDAAGFTRDIDTMLRYRDKFIAHLDSDLVMHVPALGAAKNAVWFYYTYLTEHEASGISLAGLPLDLDAGYIETQDEARTIYQQAG